MERSKTHRGAHREKCINTSDCIQEDTNCNIFSIKKRKKEGRKMNVCVNFGTYIPWNIMQSLERPGGVSTLFCKVRKDSEMFIYNIPFL